MTGRSTRASDVSGVQRVTGTAIPHVRTSITSVMRALYEKVPWPAMSRPG